MATKIIVQISGSEAYSVRIGSALVDQLGSDMRSIEALSSLRDALVITDENVADLYLAKTKSSLSQAGFSVSDIKVVAGEEAKTPEVAGEIWQAMLDLNLGRDCVVVSLGGGVVGDLAGFVASTYMRGVPVVHVPTTLLAQVDASLGGKTALNIANTKNAVGSFWHPSFVCASSDVLGSLPDEQWRSGCAEIAKMAMLDSDDFFFWLSDHAKSLASRDEKTILEAIKRSIVYKAHIVTLDPRDDQGKRRCLNYGHTFAHALESSSSFNLPHGQAVAEGIRFASRLAFYLGYAHLDFVEAQAALLDDLGLTRAANKISPEEIISHITHDKKRQTDPSHQSDVLNFVVLRDVGRIQTVQITDEDLLEYTRAYIL